MSEVNLDDPEEGLETAGYYVRLVCLNCGKVGPKNFKIEGEEVERRENVESNCCDNPEKIYRSNAVVPVEDILEKIEDTEEIDELEKRLRKLLTDN